MNIRRSPRPKGRVVPIAAKNFATAQLTIFAPRAKKRRAVLMGTLLELEGSSITWSRPMDTLGEMDGTLDRPFEGTAKYIVFRTRAGRGGRNWARRDARSDGARAQANQLMLTARTTSIVVRLVDGNSTRTTQVIPAKFDRSDHLIYQCLIAACAGPTRGRRSRLMVKLESRTTR